MPAADGQEAELLGELIAISAGDTCGGGEERNCQWRQQGTQQPGKAGTWHMAYAGSEKVSFTQTELVMSHFFLFRRCNQTDTCERILPTNSPRVFRCSDVKSTCTDSSSGDALTYQRMAIKSCAYLMSKDRGICQSMTSLAIRGSIPRRMLNQHCLVRCPELTFCGRQSHTSIWQCVHPRQPIAMAMQDAHHSDVTFAQVSNSGRAQMLSLPKEGRPHLPNGNRTSNRTQRGRDRSRKDAQRPRHEAVFLSAQSLVPPWPSKISMLRYRKELAFTPDWPLRSPRSLLP
jgi:hypothetical protein